MIRNEELQANADIELDTRIQRTAQRDERTEEFKTGIADLMTEFGSSTDQLKSTSEAMSGTASATNERAIAVAAASEEAAVNVQTVASAAEELSSSISEIGRQVRQSTSISNQAVTEVRRTQERIEGLAEGAQKIGEVL